jgi:hypothetical protein
MNIKQKTNQLPLRLILSLGLLALIRPVIKLFGDVFDYRVSGLATILITAAIATVWIGITVKLRVKKPVIVLALSGATYAFLSIAMAVTIQLAFPDLGDGDAKIPVLLTAGLIATTVFNLVYGAFLGFIASLVQKAVNK